MRCIVAAESVGFVGLTPRQPPTFLVTGLARAVLAEYAGVSDYRRTIWADRCPVCFMIDRSDAPAMAAAVACPARSECPAYMAVCLRR